MNQTLYFHKLASQLSCQLQNIPAWYQIKAMLIAEHRGDQKPKKNCKIDGLEITKFVK